MESPAAREYKDVRINVPWGHVVGRWYGDRQIRPILAIHGWLDNIGTWERLIPLMSQHIGVLCIDLPGHGQSSHLPKGISYHAIDFVCIIGRVMQEYNWHKVSLLGHSLGSMVCFIFCALFRQKVDLMITFDTLRPIKRPPAYVIRSIEQYVKRMLIEDEYLEANATPSYTYDKLERLLYEGTSHSVAMENCKYILNRNITKSSKNEDKYYFSRDGRLKNYVQLRLPNEVIVRMAKNIKNIPYLVIKGSESDYINENSSEIFEILHQQNRDFEFYEVKGMHHVHLNNPKDVAALLKPFINQHRLARLDTSSLAENATSDKNDRFEIEQPIADSKPNSKL